MNFFHKLSIFLLLTVICCNGSGHHHHHKKDDQIKLTRNNTTQNDVTDVIVMGDSYTDSCNAFLHNYDQNGGNKQYPFPTCPPPPQGRADGGRSWPEYIRIEQGQKESPGSPPGGSPFKADQWNIMNLAQSGAFCQNTNVPDIGQQIKLYQTHYNTKPLTNQIYSASKSTIAIIFIGTNDLHSMVKSGYPNTNQETDCLKMKLQTLHEIGFKRFVMIQIINLEDAPAFNNYKNTAFLVQQNNNQQSILFKSLINQWNDESQIDIFPSYDLFKSFYKNPREYGFKNVKQGCNYHCLNPDEYLWNDDLHPSNKAFHIFSRKLIKFIHGQRGSKLLQGNEGL